MLPIWFTKVQIEADRLKRCPESQHLVLGEQHLCGLQSMQLPPTGRCQLRSHRLRTRSRLHRLARPSNLYTLLGQADNGPTSPKEDGV